MRVSSPYAPNATPSPEPLAVGAREAAKRLGVSPRTWWRLVAMGKVPLGFKLGSRRLWRIEDIRRFVAEGFCWEGTR